MCDWLVCSRSGRTSTTTCLDFSSSSSSSSSSRARRLPSSWPTSSSAERSVVQREVTVDFYHAVLWATFIPGRLGSRVVSVLESGAEGPGFKSQSRRCLRQTVHTHCASVHQAAKLVAALLTVVRVTAGLAESNGSLPPGLWLTSPAGWLPRTGISSETLRSVIEYGLPLPFLHSFHNHCFTCTRCHRLCRRRLGKHRVSEIVSG